MSRIGYAHRSILVLMGPCAALAADPPPGSSRPEEMLQAYSRPIPGVNWDELGPHYVQMMERMFERNGWTEESDQFARELVTRIAELPPWDISGRITVLNEGVAQRYGLTPDQSAAFQRNFMRESAGFLLKHGAVVWAQAHEGLQGRSQGKPYTPAQVAKWSHEARPLFEDMKASVARLAEHLEGAMPEEKKALFRQDMDAFHKRHEALEQQTDRWSQGLWKPEEWGLEDDPIQLAATRQADQNTPSEAPAPVPRPSSPAPLVSPVVAVAPIPDRYVEHDPATWIALVIEFRKRFSLDAGQMETAWSIHAELVDRARRYTDRNKLALEAVPAAQRQSHQLFAPIRTLFVELRDRLDSLPTTAQRQEARP